MSDESDDRTTHEFPGGVSITVNEEAWDRPYWKEHVDDDGMLWLYELRSDERENTLVTEQFGAYPPWDLEEINAHEDEDYEIITFGISEEDAENIDELYSEEHREFTLTGGQYGEGVSFKIPLEYLMVRAHKIARNGLGDEDDE